MSTSRRKKTETLSTASPSDYEDHLDIALIDCGSRPYEAAMWTAEPKFRTVRIRVPKKPKRFNARAGDGYLLHVFPDGTECAVRRVRPGDPEWQGVLLVSVISVDGGTVFEETYTKNASFGERCLRIIPRGRGWFFFGSLREASSVWRRTRRHEVVS